MPRPKKDTAAEPKKRSRTGCWPCKSRKVKCGEEKPICTNCLKSGEQCDYSIRLNWGHNRKDTEGVAPITFVRSPTAASASRTPQHEHVFSAQHIATGPTRPPSSHIRSNQQTPEPTPHTDSGSLDPRLRLVSQNPSGSLHATRHQPHQTQSSPQPSNRSTPTSAPAHDDFRWSPKRGAKRVKLDASIIPQDVKPHHSPVFAVPQHPFPVDLSPVSTFTPHSIGSVVNTPATPGSSINSGSPLPTAQGGGLGMHNPPDLRRLSVKSLLSDPSEENEKPRHHRTDSSHVYRTYGYDHGLVDWDVPRNDDHSVFLPKSPDLRRASTAVSEVSTSSGEIDAKQIAFEPGGYYAQPVAIRIPRSLEPLPDELLQNQMSLLYFHHFINHTGRILVPHDCAENPLRVVLPQMAVCNTHLLHLMLAFSASHRARLLDHPEPVNRIAGWMSDVIPALRQSLDTPATPGSGDPGDLLSLAPLATAILLASLAIISPNTAMPIAWQDHLAVARRMIVAKGGLDHLAQKAGGVRDKVVFFLSRHFAYLDVLGALSAGKNDKMQLLHGAYLEDGGGLWLVNRSDQEMHQIDCFFGFTGRCISLLAQVAELSARCNDERIDQRTNQPKDGWAPSDDVMQQALRLQERLRLSAETIYRGCTHQQENEEDIEEIYVTNKMYHFAGLIQLSRRVLGLPTSHPDVQTLVNQVMRSLDKVRRGSSAESCLLFPMFSAGCEAQTDTARRLFMDRLKAVEGWGMQHFGQARAIMQSSWDTGRPWETLIDGQFIG